MNEGKNSAQRPLSLLLSFSTPRFVTMLVVITAVKLANSLSHRTLQDGEGVGSDVGGGKMVVFEVA